jgi:phosphopantothenoylcysteine decarboxylase/phosphopantothenate--cysteine ligase
MYFAAKEGDLVGKTVMITAGPTYEKIDPVRFIGNYSSGKMGLALADECTARGAKVILIAGPVQQGTYFPMHQYHAVESAQEMFEVASAAFVHADAAILTAAVADYTPEQVADEKIKREKTGEMSLNLKPTRDIAAFLGNLKNDAEHCQRLLIGFALETHNEQMNAEDKLNRKNLDFIVLNSLNDKGAGFRCDTNKISIIDHQGKTDYPLKSKAEVAADIVDRLVKDLNSK